MTLCQEKTLTGAALPSVLGLIERVQETFLTKLHHKRHGRFLRAEAREILAVGPTSDFYTNRVRSRSEVPEGCGGRLHKNLSKFALY